ncbi:MAG: hypothetical protein WCE48_04285 [Steroidobacteraceae bacterium]
MRDLVSPSLLNMTPLLRRAALRLAAALLSCAWVFVAGMGSTAEAAVNAATAVIGDGTGQQIDGGDGTGTARIVVNSTALGLVKQARDLTGQVLPDNTTVTPGQEIYFVLYVDNPTDFVAANLSLSDQIDETQFSYVANSIEFTTVAAGASDAIIWAASWAPLTDVQGAPDDQASIIDTGGPPSPDRLTAGDVPAQANVPINLPAHTRWAIRFRVKVN